MSRSQKWGPSMSLGAAVMKVGVSRSLQKLPKMETQTPSRESRFVAVYLTSLRCAAQNKVYRAPSSESSTIIIMPGQGFSNAFVGILVC